MPVSDKHTSLLRFGIKYWCKMFYSIGTRQHSFDWTKKMYSNLNQRLFEKLIKNSEAI